MALYIPEVVPYGTNDPMQLQEFMQRELRRVGFAVDKAVELGLPLSSVSDFMLTLLDDTTAGDALTTLGISAYIQTLLNDANAATAQTTLGISAYAQTLLDDANAAAARVTLGVDLLIPVECKYTQFTASGTYTPDAKLLFGEARAYGAGGGGGGAAITAAGATSGGTGGNGGALAIKYFKPADVLPNLAVTIGTGGAGGVGAAGSAGGVTTLGSILSAKGGEGGAFAPSAGAIGPTGVAPTQSATGDFRGYTGRASNVCYAPTTSFAVQSDSGAAPDIGYQTTETVNANGAAAPANTGSGGGGALNLASQGAARTGGVGGSGLLIIKEYLHA